MKKILIADPTLRDGSHAIQHKFSTKVITTYCKAAEAAGIPIIEIGHGNGLGASSIQVGQSLLSDLEMIRTARENLKNTKLGIFDLPGYATINKDLKPAIEAGVDVVRVGAHCTETDLTQRHLGYVREKGKIAHAAVMMVHMAPKETLIEECLKMESYGAQGIILMDSAGAFLPVDVTDRISALVNSLTIPVGFHSHNNLGMAVANSIAAVEAGALILDGTARGLGAGAGNTPIEILVAVLHKMGYETDINLYKILDASDIIEKELPDFKPSIKPISIISGLAGVFSGFSKHVERISKEYDIDPRDVFIELGKRKVVAGQEDLIVEVAIELSTKREK
ncbi:MAG: 4-hydroxy-2-oxovalerate aldolase [Elusimicrobia bacterium]|nr:4-hydroxy-2-oxovalerate aldolase [Elusimicrobiota bacterium]MBU2615121.1 4-hydroxy-2-oxovalerate aldolase [Elusimicrobiota bacterium]